MVSAWVNDDALFRGTLPALSDADFEVGSSEARVYESIQALVDSRCAEAEQERLAFVRLTAAQVIRVVIKCWRELPGLDKPFGPDGVADKFEYGNTALQSIGTYRNQLGSFQYKLARCFTEEIKRQGDEMTPIVLQAITDGASKAYLVIMEDVDSVEGAEDVEGIEADPPATTATYTSTIAFPKESMPINEDEEEEASRPSKKRKTGESAAAVSEDADAIKGCGSGNFGYHKYAKWTRDEHYDVEQQIRKDPFGTTWQELADSHNAKWSGTEFFDPKEGMIKREDRSEPAVQKRFVKFRQVMRKRNKDGDPTQGTKSDVEPDDGAVVDDDGEEEAAGATKGDQDAGDADGEAEKAEE